jgi:hypothetical protein
MLVQLKEARIMLHEPVFIQWKAYSWGTCQITLGETGKLESVLEFTAILWFRVRFAKIIRE